MGSQIIWQEFGLRAHQIHDGYEELRVGEDDVHVQPGPPLLCHACRIRLRLCQKE